MRCKFGQINSSRLIMVLSLSLCLASCQPTPEEPIVVNKADGKMEEAIHSTPVPQEVKTPEPTPVKYTDTYPGADDTVTIHIDADVTGQGNMPVVEVKPHYISMDQIKTMANVLFRGNTAYEPKVGMSKADLEQEILKCQKHISSNEAMLEYYGGDQKIVDDVKAEYTKRIADYQKQYASAPDTIEIKETDWNFRPEAYYTDMAIFGVGLNDENDEQSVALKKMYNESETIRLDSNVDGYYARINVMNLETDRDISHSVKFMLGSKLMGDRSPSWDEIDGKPMTMTRDEVVFMVSDTLTQMGIPNMQLYTCYAIGKATEKGVAPPEIKISDEQAALYAAAGEGTDPQNKDGTATGGDIYTYNLTFVPTYEGAVAANMALFNSSPNKNEYGPKYTYEELGVVVHNGMITFLEWRSPMEQVKVENGNVPVLSLEDATAAFKKQMQLEYTLAKLSRYAPENDDYEQYISRIESGEITINHISLNLMRVRVKDKPGAFRMIPVWIFEGDESLKYKGVSEQAEPRNRDRNMRYATINALDGSVIDATEGY